MIHKSFNARLSQISIRMLLGTCQTLCCLCGCCAWQDPALFVAAMQRYNKDSADKSSSTAATPRLQQDTHTEDLQVQSKV